MVSWERRGGEGAVRACQYHGLFRAEGLIQQTQPQDKFTAAQLTFTFPTNQEEIFPNKETVHIHISEGPERVEIPLRAVARYIVPNNLSPSASVSGGQIYTYSHCCTMCEWHPKTWGADHMGLFGKERSYTMGAQSNRIDVTATSYRIYQERASGDGCSALPWAGKGITGIFVRPIAVVERPNGSSDIPLLALPCTSNSRIRYGTHIGSRKGTDAAESTLSRISQRQIYKNCRFLVLLLRPARISQYYCRINICCCPLNFEDFIFEKPRFC